MLIRNFHHTFRMTRWSGIVLLAGMAVTLTFIRFWFLPQIDLFRSQLEKALSREWQQPVHIQKIRATLYHLTPQLQLMGITVGDSRQHAIWAREVQIVVDLLSTLNEHQLHIESVRLVGTEIHIEKNADGDLVIQGLGGNHDEFPPWLSQDGHFELIDSSVYWHLGNPLPPEVSPAWHNLRIQLVNRGTQHHLLLSFHGSDHWTKQAWLQIRFQGNPRHPFQGIGRFHLSLEDVHLAPLQQILTSFVSSQPLKFFHGHGRLEAIGHWQRSELESRIALELKQAEVQSPELETPLRIQNLDASLDFHLSGQDWKLKTTYLRIQGKGLDFSGRLSMDQTAGQPPNLEMFGMISELELARLCSTLRTKQATGLNQWLKPLPLQGKINGRLLWRGKLADYPFTHSEGIAEARLVGQNLSIRFLPDWPALKHADVRLTLLNDDIQLRLTRASFAGAGVGPATGTIHLSAPDPVLTIEARARPTMAEVFTALARSPLKENIQRLTEQVDLVGRGHLKLRVDIPLLHAFDTRVQGKALIKRSTLSVRSLPFTLTEVKGDLVFDRSRIETKLTGLYQERPAHLVATADGKLTDIHLETRLRASHLSDSIPFHHSLEGETDVSLALVQQGNRPAKLTLQSDLKGITVHLPAPFGKTATRPHPFTLSAWLEESNELPLTLDYPPIHAALSINTRSGSIRGRVGINEPPPPPNRHLRQGIIVQGSLSRLDLPSWLHALPRLNAAQNRLALISKVGIGIDHLMNDERDLGSYRVTAQANDDRWEGHLDTPLGSGKWRYTHQPERLDLTFSRLDMDALAEMRAATQTARDSGSVSFEHWPAIHFNSHELLFAGRNLGHVDLHALPAHSTLLFDLKLTGPTHRLEASGKWLTRPQAQTRIQGHFSSPSLGEFLKKINHPTALAETPAQADFELNWPASPHGFSLPRLNGQMELDMGPGRWLDVEPGAGRLFGLLYLGTLQRRLRLDFSDLFSTGLSYDHISGHIRMANGKAYTDDLVIEAVTARIFISGSVDLVEQRTDELVTVIPNTPLTLGIVGQDHDTQVGKAAGLLQRLINSPLDSITQSQYAITGTWDQPVIIRLRRSVPGTILDGIWSGLKIITGNHDAQ